jgi:hypothetical protein
MCPDTVIWGHGSGHLTSAQRFTIGAQYFVYISYTRRGVRAAEYGRLHAVASFGRARSVAGIAGGEGRRGGMGRDKGTEQDAYGQHSRQQRAVHGKPSFGSWDRVRTRTYLTGRRKYSTIETCGGSRRCWRLAASLPLVLYATIRRGAWELPRGGVRSSRTEARRRALHAKHVRTSWVFVTFGDSGSRKHNGHERGEGDELKILVNQWRNEPSCRD